MKEFALLNAFELLWNIDKQVVEGASDMDCQLDSEQMNLVQVLSHYEEQPDIKNALSFKADQVESLVQTCNNIRAGFLT